MDLPLSSKYLLIAAFLASFVPPKRDHIFIPNKTKRKKYNTTSRRKNEKNELILHGPSTFPLSRLMFIYKAIIVDKTMFNVNLISKVRLSFLPETHYSMNLSTLIL